MLMIFQQMSGINAIMFYAETIFEEAHFKVRKRKESFTLWNTCQTLSSSSVSVCSDLCPVSIRYQQVIE